LALLRNARTLPALLSAGISHAMLPSCVLQYLQLRVQPVLEQLLWL
jgi:hypothetical protein